MFAVTRGIVGVLALAAAGSCAVTDRQVPFSEGDVDYPQDYRRLVGKFADEGVSQPLVADEAYVDMQDFFVRYHSEDGIVYAGGRWSQRLDIATVEQQQDGVYGGPYILPIEFQQSARWDSIPESPITPRILDSRQWKRFLNSLMASLLPEDEKLGVVMHFEADDYFLYLNARGDVEARLLVDKPAEFRISEQLEFGEFIKRGMPQLKSFLEFEGIEDRRIVFNTGDAGPYSLPFLYVDIDFPIAVFVRYPAAPGTGPPLQDGTHIAQSAGHVAQSHLGGMVVRPVSSIFRLLFVVKDAAVETVRPTWMVALDSMPIPPLHVGPGMDLGEWERHLDQLTGRGPTGGTIDYLIGGERFFTRFVDEVSGAERSIDLRTYIFDNDDYAAQIARLLKRKSSEGVEVRILLDGLGTILATGADDESMPKDYVPPASVHQFLEHGADIRVRQARNPWMAGDHVKTTIIDSRVAFTGGMNIGREYRYAWHDMMMEVQGPVVDVLEREFNDAWVHAGPTGDFGYFFHKLRPHRMREEGTGYPVRVLFTRPGNAEIFRAQRDAIRRARGYIYVENAYMTDDAMLYELARARKRGVDVRVIMPLVGNHGPINQSNALAANAMMEQGIRVFVYPGMSHVKAAVFDGWACLGSANWDKLSFRVNKELNLATSHPEAVDTLLRELFDKDFSQAVELTEPFPERWSDYLVEVLADYLL